MSRWPTRLAIGCLGGAVVVLCACSGGPHEAISGRHVYGAGNNLLLVTRTTSPRPRNVTAGQARAIVDSPSTSPSGLRQQVVLFGYGDVTVTGGDVFTTGNVGTNVGKSRPAPYRGRVAWVGVYKNERGGAAAVSCPLTSGTSDHAVGRLISSRYQVSYFAVVVDATTGAETDWIGPEGNPCPTATTTTS